MDLARDEYRGKNFSGFIQADITNVPFSNNTFSCIIALGLMHRVPGDIRKRILKQINSLSTKFVIVSYSIDSRSQGLKRWIIRKVRTDHQSAPAPFPLLEIVKELRFFGLKIRKRFDVAPFLSAEVIFFLEKDKLA